MKTYTLTFGQSISYVHPHPDRTTRRAHGGMNFDLTFKIWPSRAMMARAIRKQQMREGHFDDWQPLVSLSPGEGF